MEQSEVANYYDEFSIKFLRDYLRGNHRVALQWDFFRRAISPGARRIALVGSGSGEGAWFVARKCARKARLVAADISPRSIELGRRLFAHPRIKYVVADLTQGPLPGKFDTILLPDVYEHIPVALRPAFHAQIKAMLDEGGRVLVTAPTPATQECLRRSGEGLQIVDEDITLRDLQTFSDDIGGALTFYSLVAICNSCNNYFHAAIEKGPPAVRPATYNDDIRIRTLGMKRVWPALVRHNVDRVRKAWVSWRLIRLLGLSTWRKAWQAR